MQLHQVQPKTKPQRSKRVGRGGDRGTYSGRGMKGQRARAGTRKYQPLIRRWIKRYPKLRGYRFSPVGEQPAVVNVGEIAESFESESEVTPPRLVEKGLIPRRNGRVPPVKILGDGEAKTAVTVRGCTTSQSAREKIIEAGGKII